MDQLEVIYVYDCGHCSEPKFISKDNYIRDVSMIFLRESYQSKCAECFCSVNIVNILSDKKIIRDKKLKFLGI
jgi:hypothetical protein